MDEKYLIELIDGNESRVLSQYESIQNLRIYTGGNVRNNVLRLRKGCRFAEGSVIRFFGSDTVIDLGDTTGIYNINVFALDNVKLIIGGGITMRQNIEFVLNDSGSSVVIGNGCMLSKDISFLATLGHTIIDSKTKSRLNNENSIIVGDNVWIDRGVVLYPGTIIGSNCYVGSNVSVCGKYGNNLSIGFPPKVDVLENIDWDRAIPSRYNSVDKKKIIAVIPARYASSRFPGKPLALISGKPMIQWVYEQVKKVSRISGVFVATDDHRIVEAVEKFGGNAILTDEYSCGTERVYHASKNIDADIILNIQGDEPMIKPSMIDALISAFEDSSVVMATLKKKITKKTEITNPNIAKVITDVDDNAIVFSRSVIPYNRDNVSVTYYKHIGVYGYKKDFLETFSNLQQTEHEMAEQLEQLRAIDNGYKIKVIETQNQSIGVDLPEHIQLVEKEMDKEKKSEGSNDK